MLTLLRHLLLLPLASCHSPTFEQVAAEAPASARERNVAILVYEGVELLDFAGPGEVFVSRTIKDLVAGSGLEFADRGVHTLRGVPGRWRLFAVQA